MLNYSIAVRCTTPGTKKDDVKESKAYAVSQITEIMSLQEFARHISDHGSTYSRADVVAVIMQMVDCMREKILEGKKVQLGDLGNFYASVSSTGAVTASQFTANNINDVHVVWEPGSEFQNLMEDAEFNLVASREEQEKAVNKDKQQATIVKTNLE